MVVFGVDESALAFIDVILGVVDVELDVVDQFPLLMNQQTHVYEQLINLLYTLVKILILFQVSECLCICLGCH